MILGSKLMIRRRCDMADDTGKKGWWGSIGKEFLVSLIGDAGVFVLLRSLFKNGVQATGEMITERVKQRVMNDKRAQMMREMRKMEVSVASERRGDSDCTTF